MTSGPGAPARARRGSRAPPRPGPRPPRPSSARAPRPGSWSCRRSRSRSAPASWRCDGRIRRIAKTLEHYDCGYVGMTKIPAAALGRYWAEADAALAEEGRAIHVERVLARLALTSSPPACRDISGHGWLEVDLPEERDRAEARLRQGPW